MSFNFGQAASTAFGTPAVSTSGGFGFGSTPTTTTAFGAFGAPASTATTGTGFGFGATTTTSAPSFGGFGSFGPTSTTTAGSSLFNPGFGAPGAATTSATSFAFPSAGATTSASTFGTGNTFGTPTFGGTLGGGLTTTTGAFGTGSMLGGSSGFGGGGTGAFGSTLGNPSALFGGQSMGIGGGGGLGTFGQQQQMQAAGQQASSVLANMATSLTSPVVFGDERDAVMAKWNKLQAFWGTGKGIFSATGQYVDFGPDNPFCRFKAIGYSCVPGSKNEDGLIAILINRKHTDVVAQQQQLVDALQRVINKPTLAVCVEGVKPVPENKTEVVFYILDRQATGVTNRVAADAAYSFFNQPNVKQQLSALGTEGITSKSAPTKQQMEHYLNNPAAGIDPLLWQQAKLDNPDPVNMIPIPLIGFTELQLRIKHQDQETKQHQGRLNVVADEIVQLQRRHTNTVAKIDELKRKQLELGHRVLTVMCNQEIARNGTLCIQTDEEQLKNVLETFATELNAPNQYKGRLNELLSQIRMQNQQTLRCDERYNIDNTLLEELKQVLKYQQDGISNLIGIIKSDFEELRLIEAGYKEEIQRR